MYDYSQYYTSSQIGEITSMNAAIGAIAGFLVAYLVVILAVMVVYIIGMWRMFSKAGEPGWKSLIPIYNMVTLFKIAGISPWLVLGYIAVIIPGIGALVALGITIYTMINLAKAFGQGGGFAAGLILLQPIFICILGFGKAEYQGNTPTNTEA